MDFRKLRYFIEIVDCGSLSKAAARLYVAQPALSQQISALEAELKAQLLVRNPRGVVATDAGRVLYRHARNMLRDFEQARHEIRHPHRGESGLVAVGLPPTLGVVVGLPLFTAVRKKQPGIHLQLVQTTGTHLSELLADGRLDMCMTHRDSFPAGHRSQVFLDEGFFVVGKPAGRRQDTTCPLRALAGVPMLLPGPGLALRVLVERAFARVKIELNVVGDIDSTPCLVTAAASGLGCTILPWSALPHWYVEGSNPPPRLLVEPGIERPISLCFSTLLPRTPAASAVASMLIDVVEELAGSGRWVGARLRSADSRQLRQELLA